MTQLVEFGWSEHYAQYFTAADDHLPARVIAEHRESFRVQTEDGERPARISGKMRHEAVARDELPAVGDWVAVQSSAGEGDVVIHRVLPRKSKFSRKAAGQRTEEQIVAANVDTVWIVSALDRDFNLRRIERYLTLAWESGANPVVVLTKSDLCDDVAGRREEVEAIAIGMPVHTTSSFTLAGLGELQCYFKNHATIALLGSSGVGKSSLINALAGTALQAIAEVRGDGKGRHTTIHRQLLRLPEGGLIIDTPGMRELQLWDSESGLSNTFSDVDELAANCRFTDCRHAGEPGCAVQQAVDEGQMPPERLQSYQKLQRELAHLERKQDVRAQHEAKRRHKMIHKSLREHPKFKR